MDTLASQTTPLLEVSALHTSFNTDEGIVRAVDGVDFHIQKGEILGIVGESGCGKSVTALSVMRLIRSPGKIESGDIKFHGESLLAYPEEEMRQLRGKRISMIFQQPQSSLNPVLTVGSQLAESFEIHSDMEKEERWSNAVELLQRVGIPDARSKAHAYPHEMSGGQAQRVLFLSMVGRPLRTAARGEPRVRRPQVRGRTKNSARRDEPPPGGTAC